MALSRRSFSVLTALLPAAGLASQAYGQTEFKGEGGKVRVASFPGGNDYPFWAIAKLGLDRKYGFELENVSVQPGGAALTAFRSGAVEGGLMNWLELARVRTAGEEIAAIVPFLEMPNVWVVPKSSSAKTVADLKGRKVGTYNRFSPEWVLYLSTAKSKFGYDPRTESTIQEAGPGLLRGLMDQKQIDATFIFYNLAMPMVASGEYRILFNSKDLLKLAGMICPHVGGSFGAKIHLYSDEVATVAVSRLIGRPVKYIAKERRLDVDLHVDENGAPSSTTLAQVAEAVMRHGFEGHVVCGHCCSMSMQEEPVWRRTIALARDAGLTIVSLPLVNQFLQGRIDGGTPRWRGIPLLRELKAAGVAVALASDNCRDPYHAFGDHDMIEVFGAGVRMGHLEAELDRWPSSITTVPASVLGVAEGGRIRRGGPADFQLFGARDYSELLARRQPDRLVIRGGRLIDAQLPDYRKLDRIVARGQIVSTQ